MGALQACCLFLVLLVVASHSAAADIELKVPLRDGRFYSLHGFIDECNDKLGMQRGQDDISDEVVELTGIERAALLLANDADLLKVRFEQDRLILIIPDSQDEVVRRRIRNRLGLLFGIDLNEWPANRGLHVPADLDSSRRTVLLIHGLEAGIDCLRPLQTAFEQWGVQVLLFDFPNDGPAAWSGERLSGDLRRLAAAYPDLRLSIIAHSMGGLVARYALETPGQNPGCVTDLFLIGTPNAGSRLSGTQPWLETWQEILPQPQAVRDAITDGLGEAANDLRPDSPFLATLNRHPRPPDVRYYCGIGRRSFVSDEQREVIEREIRSFLQRRSTPEDVQERILSLLRAAELQDGRGDGAVTISSARLPDVDAEKTFDLNHRELLRLPAEAPEEGEVFRWIVETLQWPRGER